jgi:hypothetical protein
MLAIILLLIGLFVLVVLVFTTRVVVALIILMMIVRLFVAVIALVDAIASVPLMVFRILAMMPPVAQITAACDRKMSHLLLFGLFLLLDLLKDAAALSAA